jgi:hypothetical protein
MLSRPTSLLTSADRWLAGASVVPALLVVAWLLAGLPMLFGGVFTALPVIALAVPLAVLIVPLGVRRLPQRAFAPSWAALAVLAVAVVFCVTQGLVHAEQIIVRRDPASYVQFTTWLAEHGTSRVHPDAAAFGHDPGVSYESLAFYQRGGLVVPQFMAGLPMVLSAAHWIGGTSAVLFTPVVLGGLAILAFGGLVARLAGPRWAPLGALGLALTLPEEFFSRSAYSEPLTQILLFGGLCLLLDAFDLVDGPYRIRAGLAGLALGLTVLVRIDALRDVLPVLAYAGLLVYQRRPEAWPLGGGLALGAGLGLTEGYVLSRPYLSSISDSVLPMLGIAVVIALLTAAFVVAARVRARLRPAQGLPSWLRRAGPGTCAGAVVAMMLALAARPFFMVVRQPPAKPEDVLTVQYVTNLQRVLHLPIDGTRVYTEMSLDWVAWYVGAPAVMIATAAAAVLTYRTLRGRAVRWVLPLAMIGWTTLITLYRPAITPDHPWAARRLVVLVLPGMVLLAVWGTAAATRWVRDRGHRTALVRGAAAVGALLVCVPALITSIGMATARTDAGELAAVRGMCRALGPRSAVVILERATADRFTQLVRGMCGVPTGRITDSTRPVVHRVERRIRAAGRQPVLIGADASDVRPYGRPVHIMSLHTRQDPRSLVRPPHGTWSLTFNIWAARPRT